MASEAVIHKGNGSGDRKVGAFVQDSLGQVVRAEIGTDYQLASRWTTWWKPSY